MGEGNRDIFGEENVLGLDEGCEYEVIIGEYEKPYRSDYEEGVQAFRDEVNAFIREHTVLESHVYVRPYTHGSRSHVLHEAWILYEPDEVDDTGVDDDE